MVRRVLAPAKGNRITYDTNVVPLSASFRCKTRSGPYRANRVVALLSKTFSLEAAPFADKLVELMEPVARSLGINLLVSPTRDAAEIDHALAAVSGEPKGGLIINPDAFTAANRGLIISLAARYHLPAIYPLRFYAVDGGLLSYGPDLNEPWRRTPSYIDKILKGASPADLPIQQPTKFELIINLKTVKSLGLAIPPQLLDRATDLIE